MLTIGVTTQVQAMGVFAGQGDSMLSRLQGPAASAANRWSGNRGGYEDPVAQRLLATYYASISDEQPTCDPEQSPGHPHGSGTSLLG
jgi:hypothetical protein